MLVRSFKIVGILPDHIPSNEIVFQFISKTVVDVDYLKVTFKNVSFHVYCQKDP